MLAEIPRYLLFTGRFNGQSIPNGELIQKHWTPTMIALLGKPASYNAAQVPFFARHKIEHVMKSAEFESEALNLVNTRLLLLGGEMPVSNETLSAGCAALFDLNKHVKYKRFTARLVRKAYELKTILLRCLMDFGYVTDMVFEGDTQLFRFKVEIAGKTYIWHQPCKKFVLSCLDGASQPSDDCPVIDDSHHRVMKKFERVVLSLVADKMKEEA